MGLRLLYCIMCTLARILWLTIWPHIRLFIVFSVLERFRCQPPDGQPIRFSGQVKQVIISHFCNTGLVNCKIVSKLFLLLQSENCVVQNHGMENFGSKFTELELLICQYYKSIKIFVAKKLLTSSFCNDSPNPSVLHFLIGVLLRVF